MDTKLIPANIIDLLKRTGSLKYAELYKRTKKQHSGFSEEHLNTLLMKMEIQGLVRVYRLPKGKRRVELALEGQMGARS